MRKLPPKPRILYVTEAHSGPYPYVFAGVPDVMETMGFEVSRLDPGSANFEMYRERINKFKPDVIFCFIRYLWAARKFADFLKEYHPVVVLNWYQEDPNFTTDEYLSLSKEYDFWFTIDANMVPFWQTKTYFMPPAFDERIYKDYGVARCYDVAYVGQLGHELSTRMYLPYMEIMAAFGKKAMLCLERPMSLPALPGLERVLRSFKLRPYLARLPIWKCGWTNPKDEEEKALVMNQSKICPSLSRVWGPWERQLRATLPEYPKDKSGYFYQPKPRAFHAVGVGAMLLSDYYTELESLFDLGREAIVFEFGNLEEFREKLSWYTAHDQERERVAKAGFERGRKQHTFACRIRRILSIVERDS